MSNSVLVSFCPSEITLPAKSVITHPIGTFPLFKAFSASKIANSRPVLISSSGSDFVQYSIFKNKKFL